MSGFVGILQVDGAAVDRSLLEQMTDFLSYRGPDAQNIWIAGRIGFGHTLLRTTRESVGETQPCSLDGRVWITADARLDARAELVEKLQSRGRAANLEAPDVELLLHAYHCWEEECVHHLLGDFAFAIWDGRREHLFCARDHFGIKPFYFALVKDGLLFSNTLNCLRGHPGVSDELNDVAVGDFLLFGCNLNLGTSTFADIQRLPPANCLSWSQGGLRTSRYWAPPTSATLRYRRAEDYVERFRDGFRAAIEDRLRAERVGVFMSGGLDSTTVAAMARALLSRKSARGELRAHTVVYDRLIGDKERLYSGLVAKFLGIPIHYLVADNYHLYERWDEFALQLPEPVEDPLFAGLFDQYQQVAAHSRVVLTGDGGDALLLFELGPYLREALKHGRFFRLAIDLAGYVGVRPRLLPPGFGRRLKESLRKRPSAAAFPSWFNPDFAARVDLRARCARPNRTSASVHPLRPRAYASLDSPALSNRFENSDPGVTRCPVEARHPFLDLRLVNFLMVIPPIPWSVDKELLRVAMRNVLPEAVRLRPKTPFGIHPALLLLRDHQAKWLDGVEPAPELARYVIAAALPPLSGAADNDVVWLRLRTLSLNFWLRAQKRPKYKPIAETAHEARR